MHPADINAALRKAGSNQARIAEQLRISGNAISNVIYSRMTSYRVANAIAKVTGLSVNTLWPGKYNRTAH